MKREGLFYGAVILLFSNVISKFLGFFYRVVLVRILGSEGIGLIEMVTPVYAFVLVVSTWGIPLAMSKLISEEMARGNTGNIRKTFRTILVLLTLSGSVATIGLYLFAPWIMKTFITDQRTYYCLIIMVPVIFIIAICSVFRSYFQGIQQISVLGLSQNVEQVTRVVIGIWLAIKLKPYGLHISITAVSIATVLGEIAGLLYMLYRYRKTKLQQKNAVATKRIREILRYIFTFGTPVTMARVIASLLLVLQASLIPKCLMMAGYDLRTATSIYGNFVGVAISLLHLPGIITITMAVSIIPAVGEAIGKKDYKLLNNRILEALQITVVLTVPSMIILFMYPWELANLIFHAPEAGGPLRILALGGIFLYLQHTLTGILQGLGKVKTLLINLCIAGVFMIGGIMLLTPLPNLGIIGTAIAMSVSFCVGSLLNYYYLGSTKGLDIKINDVFTKPFIAGTTGLIVLLWLDHWLRQSFPNTIIFLLMAMAILTIIYYGIIFLTKGLNPGTIKRIASIRHWVAR